MSYDTSFKKKQVEEGDNESLSVIHLQCLKTPLIYVSCIGSTTIQRIQELVLKC